MFLTQEVVILTKALDGVGRFAPTPVSLILTKSYGYIAKNIFLLMANFLPCPVFMQHPLLSIFSKKAIG